DCTASELQGILTHFVNMGYESPLMEEITSELNKDVFGETEVIEIDRVSTDRVHVIIARTDRALEGIYGTPKFRQVRTLRRMLPYAAAILVFLSFGVWFLYDKTTPVENSKIAEQILPASNRTTLTFNDGRSIELSSAQSSVIVGENTLRYADGTSIHTGADGAQLKKVDELTFSTSKGGTLALTLPDGSSVWLNAESKLSFPAHFSKDVRRVQLEGEAYFDIKSQFADRSDLSTLLSPVSFIVETKQQHIEVLGTQFNVSAYPDDLRRTTTLVEGLVRVKDTRSGHTLMLSPGQQSSLADDMDLVK